MKDDEVNITDDHSSLQRGLRYLLDGETEEKAHEDIVHQEVHAHLHIVVTCSTCSTCSTWSTLREIT